MKYKKYVAIGFVIVVVCACVAYIAYAELVVSINQDKYYPVVSVIDGDTFKAKVGRHVITVRLLGIDTPETVDPRKPEQCYGIEASNETKKILAGQSVRLQLNPDREEKDRYGRYLAYAYLADNTLLNKYLIENGFAREYTYGKSYVFQTDFKESEETAKKNRIGLWGVCDPL